MGRGNSRIGTLWDGGIHFKDGREQTSLLKTFLDQQEEEIKLSVSYQRIRFEMPP